MKPNPRLGLAREAIREAIAFGADLILAVGGGSVIDTAKATAHGTANPEADIWDIWMGKVKLEKSLPVGVVLTIPAAGSEMSDSAVLTDEAALAKRGLNTDLNRPAFALMDPALAGDAAGAAGGLRRDGHYDAHAGAVCKPAGERHDGRDRRGAAARGDPGTARPW